MLTRAAAQRAPWPQLPAPLWEQIAGLLPIGDVMALRQAWCDAGHLSDARVRSAAAAWLLTELSACVRQTARAAWATARDGVAETEEALDAMDVAATNPEVDLVGHLTSWLCGAMVGAHGGRSVRYLPERPLWPIPYGHTFNSGMRW